MLEGRPVFLVERSWRLGEAFPELVRRARLAAGDAVQTGVVVNLAQRAPAVAKDIIAHSEVELAIADPSLHRHRDLEPRNKPEGPDPWARDRRWLTRTIPTQPDLAMVGEILDAQRQAGATLLLTPTGTVPEANGERALGRAMRWVHAARAAAPAESMAVNLTLTRGWLTDDHLLEILLNEIVDSNERVWYVRVNWGSFAPPRQLDDSSLLRGYAQLAATAAGENKTLLLPQTSLVGWLALGLGAGGFSTGTGGHDHLNWPHFEPA